MTKPKLHRLVLFTLIATAVAIILSVIIFPAASRIVGLSSAHGVLRETAENILKHGYIRRTFMDDEGRSLVYYLYIPSNYNPWQKYPLVLLLHGDGEKSNPRKTAAQNQAALLKQPYVRVWTSAYAAPDNPYIQQRWPCFVVVPQITTTQQWINVSLNKGFYTQGFYIQKRHPAVTLSMTMHILNVLQREYAGIDARRRYITGISSGAFGVWDAIERWPNYFAAAAPLAGAGDPSHAALLRYLPIWIFHGGRDNVVTVRGSRTMFAAIRKAGGRPLYTEFPGLKHGIWGNVYALPGAPQPVAGFFPWLFSQKRWYYYYYYF
jgi:predicted peptidase